MLKEIPLIEFYRLINHGPVVLVTSGKDEKTNIAPIAWLTPINDEPQLLAIPIAEKHYTTELINETGEFVINIPDKSLIDAVQYAGKASGRHENKFKMSGLSPVDGKKVKTPHIQECIGFLECRVKDRLSYDGVTVFIADVLHAEADDKRFDDTWISEKANTLHHLGGGYFAVTGKRFKAR